MLKNYLKTAYRNFVKNKTYSLINVFGMSLAFVCGILLFLNAWNELSYDEFYPEKDKIFKMYGKITEEQGEVHYTAMPYPLRTVLKSDVPQVQYASRMMWNDNGVFYNDKKIDLSTNLVDEDFFDLFSIDIINGNKSNPLHDVTNAVLTESSAEKLFGKENPVGKRIKIRAQGDVKELVVTAVTRDNPQNSSVKFDVLARPEIRRDYQENKDDWNNSNHEVYVKLAGNATPESTAPQFRYMLKKYSPEDTAYMKSRGCVKDQYGAYYSLQLAPLTDIHFMTDMEGDAVEKLYVYTLLLISIFIIAIASFNFFNLNVARSFTRTKEVGIRKCLGAGRKQVFIQIWIESFITCLISVVIGLFTAYLLIPSFNQLFGSELSIALFFKPSFIIVILISLLVISFCAGGYPALMISRFPVAGVLKGSISLKRPGFFRNSLIVLQFTIACLLMSCTLIAYKQFEFMRTMPLGYNKDAVISVPLYGISDLNGREVLQQFRNRLASSSEIVSITGSAVNLGLGKDGGTSRMNRGFGYKDKSILSTWLSVDYDFLKTIGIKTIKGRDFSRDFGTDSVSGVIVTESMAKMFGEKEPLGLTFFIDSARPPLTIIGIVPDFHLYSVHEKTGPITIDISPRAMLGYALIKTTGNNPKAAMDKVEKVFKDLAPGKEFKGSFIDENTDRWYKKEKQLSVLLGISAGVSVVISCLGLFALALLMIQQRIKEIGVRKVLGASVLAINLLLAKDFVKLVIAGIAIAIPLAWWAMNGWLRDFPYHTEITWFIFVFVGIAALAVALLTVSFHTVRAALSKPVKSLRSE